LSGVDFFTLNICVIYKLHITSQKTSTKGDVLSTDIIDLY